MNYCKICVYPDSKPGLKFDENGICSACNNNKLKSSINWEERKSQFLELLEKFFLE